MATFDEAGNVIPDNQAVFRTANPDIVKMRVSPDSPAPMYATLSTINGEQWAFYPTQLAIAMGKVVAAWDTFAEVPARFEETISTIAREGKNAIAGLPTWLLVAGAGMVLIEIMKRR